GLYYDSARKQVLYRTASEPIVCAEDATFLWTTHLKSTGQCLLKPRTEQRKVDDGFNVREQAVAQVFLEVQHASASEGMGGSAEAQPSPVSVISKRRRPRSSDHKQRRKGEYRSSSSCDQLATNSRSKAAGQRISSSLRKPEREFLSRRLARLAFVKQAVTY